MEIPFTKMQGTGNDFIVIDGRSIQLQAPGETAKRLCNRRFGIGADQLLLLLPSSKADFKMAIYNADGGEVEMCGNGIRCIAKYIVSHSISDKTALAIETLGGIIHPRVLEEMVEVNMGEPVLEGGKIPVKMDGQVISERIDMADRGFDITCVSMGNPHCVIFVDDVDGFAVSHYGPMIENLDLFPNRINVEFVQLISDREIKMRVWERGSGETLACGTGACASAVASVLNDKTHRRLTVRLRGGDLDILWGEDNIVYMTGPAQEVFRGVIEL